jgi:hypothetical protein
MTGLRAPTSASFLVACFVLWSALMTPGARAQKVDLKPGASVVAAIHFDLPAQPLADALDAYERLTRLSVMAQTRLLAGRTGAAVNGDYSSHEALQRLLAGTGLDANFTDLDEAVIVPSPSSQPSPPTVPPLTVAASDIDGVMDAGDFRAYAAMVQTRLTDALCASPQTRPGSYRLVAQLRIDASGSIVASKVVASTGLPSRDAAIASAMQAMTLDSAPPAGLPEPLTILLRPHGAGIDTDCSQFDQGESGS